MKKKLKKDLVKKRFDVNVTTKILLLYLSEYLNCYFRFKVTLFDRISTKENKKGETVHIKTKLNLYKLALSAAKEYYGENRGNHSNIQQAVSRALLDGQVTKHSSKMLEDAISVREDESVKADENNDDESLDDVSQLILDYIERFNDLFETQKYAEAAYYAVASPKNILRNIETTMRFKEVSARGVFTDATDPLLMYCNAVVDSIGESAPKPNENMSNECVKIALKFNKLDLLTRWIAQKK
jgi:hypothetical protein